MGKSNRIRDGLVLCDNCENPASRKLTKELKWNCCAACVYGEADAIVEQLEAGDVIIADRSARQTSTGGNT